METGTLFPCYGKVNMIVWPVQTTSIFLLTFSYLACYRNPMHRVGPLLYVDVEKFDIGPTIFQELFYYSKILRAEIIEFLLIFTSLVYSCRYTRFHRKLRVLVKRLADDRIDLRRRSQGWNDSGKWGFLGWPCRLVCGLSSRLERVTKGTGKARVAEASRVPRVCHWFHL